MKPITNGISVTANRIIKLVYDELVDRLSGRRVRLSRVARCLAGERFDTDTQTNYVEAICFKSIACWNKNLKGKPATWILAKGKSDGKRTLLRDYGRDLVLIPAVSKPSFGEKRKDGQYIQAIEKGTLFHNSLFFSTSDGRLSCNKDVRFGKKINHGLFNSEVARHDCSADNCLPTYDLRLVNILADEVMIIILKHAG